MEVADKKVALFEAVIALIEDGVDINSLKVSDITNRAGIEMCIRDRFRSS